MLDFSIVLYKTEQSISPVGEFIMRPRPSAYAKTLRLLDLLRAKGSDLGMPYSRALGKGLFELRVHDKQEVRLFYIFFTGQKIVILHAFQKKTQQTPLKELRLARARQSELT